MRQEWIVNKQKIICNNCLAEMREMPEKSVDVVVTSPPYNLGINYSAYEDNLKFEDYWLWMYVILKNIFRVLKDDGSFFLNVGGSCKTPRIPMEMCQIAKNAGWTLQNNIIWVKSITIKDDSYGHFKPVPGERFLNNQHESIFHFTKTGEVKLDRLAIGCPYADKSNIGRYADQDLRCRGNVWFIPYKTTQSKKQHPAGFPIELPEMCIKLHGIKEDIKVLDPFLGAGTTLLACKKLNICGVGVDLDEIYCKLSITNLEEI
jgi:site-specific DNA-methyltransferase (adenine-specific)